MSYAGDVSLGTTLDIKFTSRRFSTGAPHTLSGGDVAAYVGNGTTEITAGITLTADFDSRTGLNNVRIVASAGNGFSAGTDVTLVLTAGSVDSVSVAGEVVGSFSIENRHGSAPTAAAVADAVWDEAQAGHTAAGTFGSYLDLQLTSGVADYVQPTHTIIADKLDAMLELDGAVYRFTANALEQAPTGASAAAVADAVWDEVAGDHSTNGTFGGNLQTPTTIVNTNVVVNGINISDVLVDTGTTLPAQIAALLVDALTEAYRGTGATGSVAQLLYEIIAHLGESSIIGTTKTLKKLDGSTTAKTYTLDSAVSPTSITETT